MPPHPSQIEPLKRMMKIVSAFLTRPDVGPFREPVDWRGLGLDDYPTIVKKMMDLGTIKRKLERKQYYTATDCANDFRLIWANCMAYNADGSDFWLLAKAFARRFEDRYRKIRQEMDCGADLREGDDSGAPGAPAPKSSSGRDTGSSSSQDHKSTTASSAMPTSSGGTSFSTEPLPLDKRTRFGANLFLLSGIELAHVIMKLEQRCPEVLEQLTEEVELEDDDINSDDKAISPKLEINLDAIEPALFDELSAYVMERVGSKGHSEDEEANMVDSSSSSNPVGRPKKKKKT